MFLGKRNVVKKTDRKLVFKLYFRFEQDWVSEYGMNLALVNALHTKISII